MPVALEIMLPKDILWQGVPKPLQFIMFTPHAHCRYQRDQLVASSTVILIAVRWSPKRILAGCTHKDAVAVWLEFLEHIIKTQLTAWMINPWLVKSVLANQTPSQYHPSRCAVSPKPSSCMMRPSLPQGDPLVLSAYRIALFWCRQSGGSFRTTSVDELTTVRSSRSVAVRMTDLRSSPRSCGSTCTPVES